jgi:CRP-like cAMP-binding protein
MYNLLLDSVAMHVELSAAEREYFLSLLHNRRLKKKQFLNQEGDVSKGPAFVLQGILRSYSLDKNGFEHILQFAPPGWWIGDMYSLKYNQPGRLNIDAVTESEIAWLWKSDLENLYLRVPKFERFFRILAENSIVAYQSRLISALSLPALDRYARFCSQYPTLTDRLPQKQIAAYIGVTPEFLSKMLNAHSS